MKIINASYLLFVFAIALNLFSCVPQKQVTSSKKELTTINTQLGDNSNTLKNLDAIRSKKETQNEIDDTANARIKKFIDKTNTEIDTLIKNNTILIGETSVDKNDWERLRNTLSFSRNASKKINDKILFLNDLINRNMVVKLDQDVLFEPGKYSVDPSQVETISKLFEPAAKEIDLFTKKYPDFPLSLVITSKGYADATAIGEGSSLYRELKERLSMSTKEPDSKELNKELSRARAEAVRNLFKKFAESRSDNQIFSSKVLHLYEGKGELLPDPKVTDYKVNDPRRRVVLLFWSVFPD
jgi:outer membrane protein OmpA-like peptidoglycan-associated protein